MDIGKLLLLGAAGYVAYEYFLAPAAAAPATVAPGGIQPGPTPPSVVTSAQTTLSMLQAATQKANFPGPGTVDQWNYYYGQVRGIAPPAPEDWGFTPDNRSELLTLPEWWGIATAHGLSGLRGGYVRTNRGLSDYEHTNRLFVLENE